MEVNKYTSMKNWVNNQIIPTKDDERLYLVCKSAALATLITAIFYFLWPDKIPAPLISNQLLPESARQFEMVDASPQTNSYFIFLFSIALLIIWFEFKNIWSTKEACYSLWKNYLSVGGVVLGIILLVFLGHDKIVLLKATLIALLILAVVMVTKSTWYKHVRIPISFFAIFIAIIVAVSIYNEEINNLLIVKGSVIVLLTLTFARLAKTQYFHHLRVTNSKLIIIFSIFTIVYLYYGGNRVSVLLIVGVVLLGFISVIILSWLSGWVNERRKISDYLVAVTALLISAFFIPVILSERNLSGFSASGLSFKAFHIEVVFAGYADALTFGKQLFSDITPNYGYIVPVLIAGWQRQFGLVEFGGLLHIIELANALFILATFILIWRLSNKNWIPTLFGLIIVFSWLASSGAVMYPNMSAIRHMNFIVGLWAAFILYKYEFKQSYMWLGPMCVYLLLFNLETGIAVSGGIIAGFYFRNRNILLKSWLVKGHLVLVFTIGVLVTLFISVLVSRLLLGTWPGLPDNAFNAISHLATGQGAMGLWEPLKPFVLLMLGHASFVLIHAFSQGRQLGRRGSFRVMIATSILAWFPYYIVRPNDWGLWTLEVLYLYLIIDLFRVSRVFMLGRVGYSRLIPVVVLIFIVPTFFIQVNISRFNSILSNIRSSSSEVKQTYLLSGVLVNQSIKNEISERASFISSSDKNLVFVSSTPLFLTRLSGVNDKVSIPGVVNGLHTISRHKKLIEILTRRNEFYIESENSIFGSIKDNKEYMKRLRVDLRRNNYKISREIKGWEHWEKVNDVNKVKI